MKERQMRRKEIIFSCSFVSLLFARSLAHFPPRSLFLPARIRISSRFHQVYVTERARKKKKNFVRSFSLSLRPPLNQTNKALSPGPKPPRRPERRDPRLVLLKPRPQLGQLVPPRVAGAEPVKVRGEALGLGCCGRRRCRRGHAARGGRDGPGRDLGGLFLPALLASRHQSPPTPGGGQLRFPLEIVDPLVEPRGEGGVAWAGEPFVRLDPEFEAVRRRVCCCCCFLVAAAVAVFFVLPLLLLFVRFRRGGERRQVQRRGRAGSCRARQGLQGRGRGERDDGGALRSRLQDEEEDEDEEEKVRASSDEKTASKKS